MKRSRDFEMGISQFQASNVQVHVDFYMFPSKTSDFNTFHTNLNKKSRDKTVPIGNYLNIFFLFYFSSYYLLLFYRCYESYDDGISFFFCSSRSL